MSQEERTKSQSAPPEEAHYFPQGNCCPRPSRSNDQCDQWGGERALVRCVRSVVFLRRTTDYWRRTSYYYGERGKEE